MSQLKPSPSWHLRQAERRDAAHIARLLQGEPFRLPCLKHIARAFIGLSMADFGPIHALGHKGTHL